MGEKNLIINYKSLIYYKLFLLLTSQVCDPKDAYYQVGGGQGWGGKPGAKEKPGSFKKMKWKNYKTS